MVRFQYFLTRCSALKFPLNATEYYAYSRVPSVESETLITMIAAKTRQNNRRSKCAIVLEDYLRYAWGLEANFDLYTDFNRIKGSLD